MQFLSPLALAWLGSIPVLIWLWRYATSRRQIRIPSLVPFEHLLRRAPTHRTRLLVNWLFVLQLACLLLAALALADPVLVGRSARTTLVIIDTSASMQASLGGPSAFQRAKQELLNRIARKEPHERMVLVASAPATPLTREPLSDEVQLRGFVQRLSPSDVGGHLALAGRIGRAMVDREPDAVLILTDEPPPVHTDPAVEVRSFGRALPNMAIVGADLSDSLCLPGETGESPHESPAARLLVTVQNFSDEEQTLRLVARVPDAQDVAHTVRLLPQQREQIPLNLPAGAERLVTIRLEADRDALALDNQLIVSLGVRRQIPVVVSSERPELMHVIGRWLEACPRITWTMLDPDLPSSAEAILITDHAPLAQRWPRPSIVIAGPSANAPRLTLTHWLIDSAHPLTSYLEPLESVVTALAPPPQSLVGGSVDQGMGGEPVLWAVSGDRKVPLVLASELKGQRRVTWLLDPTATPNSVPLTLVFLNSLRWLAGSRGFAVTGEPLALEHLEPGRVRIERPDGAVEWREHPGGVFRYEATDRVGRYRVEGRTRSIERAVNFVNPVESDTMARASTWVAEPSAGSPTNAGASARYPAVHWLLRLMLVILLVEWWMYSLKRRPQTSDFRLQTTRNR
jgi:hypothetical protein